MNPPRIDLSNRRVLVTGGTGFIGGRLVERLVLECNANVRVLVRNFAHASRIARFPIEMMHGDLLAPGDVERAVGGCEIVLHCACGHGGDDVREVNVEGTRHVLEAALRHGARRMVHVSTLMVYGVPPDGVLNETAPRRYLGIDYSDSKLDAEKLALEYGQKHGAPVTVLQPTIVYGPFAPIWTSAVLQQLRNMRVLLVDGGNGLCNAVYVDDVVSAILLAAVSPKAVGEAFLISGESPVTWRDFYAQYERMLGYASTVRMSAEEATALFNKSPRKSVFHEALSILKENKRLRNRILKTTEADLLVRFARKVVPTRVQKALAARVRRQTKSESLAVVTKREKPLEVLSPAMIQSFAARTSISIDKAKRLLSFQPAFDLETGMRLTEEWAKWANLLSADGHPAKVAQKGD